MRWAAMPELHTTFALAHKAGACPPGYRAVARALGGIRVYGRNTPIPLPRVLELRGLDDALWCLRCVLPEEEAARDRLARSLSVDYGEHVGHRWATEEWHKEYALANSVAWAAARATWAANLATVWKTERDWQAQRLREVLA